MDLKAEEISKIIKPNYSEYVTDEKSKRVLLMTSNLVNWRHLHNMLFISDELKSMVNEIAKMLTHMMNRKV